MNAQSESNLTCVTLTLCDGCLNGCGGECHTPGCALWMNRAPDVPIRNYEAAGCTCGVSAPDEFGNRDLLEHPGCPYHGKDSE